MKYLFDTNIISEFSKFRPDTRVIHWAASIDASSVYISVLTVGEIKRGIEMKRNRLANSVEKLEKELERLETIHSGKVLAFDQKAAHLWGKMTAHDANNPVDAQIAAIAIVNDAILVTRNVKDFKERGVKLFNPFEPPHA